MKTENPMLYFIPGENGVGADRGVLRRVGLLPVIGDAPVVHRQVMNGPGGLNGVMVASNTDTAVVYEKAAQTWIECANFWVGYWNERKPGPRDLQRGEVVDGHLVEMGDGNDWLIPVARMVDGDTRLPQVIGFNPDGSVRLSVSQKFTAFYDAGFAIFNELVNNDRYAESAEELLSVAIEALTVNYRVGKWEAGLLGLVTTNNLVRVAQAIIDFPAIDAQRSQKKTPSDTPDSLPGPAA